MLSLRSFGFAQDDIGEVFMAKIYFVYMVTNKNNRVLYTGVTGNIKQPGGVVQGYESSGRGRAADGTDTGNR